MVVAIDINEVLRDFLNNFGKYYVKGYNHEFELDDVSFWTNDPEALFPFNSQRAYESFAYQDFAYELYGCSSPMHQMLPGELNKFMTKDVPELDVDDLDFMVVSSRESGLSIPSTLFFISKFGLKVRNYYFPKDSLTIWDKCDILITADPQLLANKPEGKVAIKIEQEYNKESEADFTYPSMLTFVRDKNNLLKAIEKNAGK